MSDNSNSLPIVICGGIGSGKSVVSRILRLRGYGVYDCDSRARAIMECDARLRKFLAGEFGEKVFRADGTLDRAFLASRIFSDAESRRRLNSRVHAAVRADIAAWREASPLNLFVESAIPATSGLLATSSGVWLVEAPVPKRVRRVCRRSALTPRQVLERIESQKGEIDGVLECGLPVTVIDNSGDTPLLPQIAPGDLHG